MTKDSDHPGFCFASIVYDLYYAAVDVLFYTITSPRNTLVADVTVHIFGYPPERALCQRQNSGEFFNVRWPKEAQDSKSPLPYRT